MIRKILFLASGSPFMVNALIGNLEKSGYEVISVGPNSRLIGKEQVPFDRDVHTSYSGLAYLSLFSHFNFNAKREIRKPSWAPNLSFFCAILQRALISQTVDSKALCAKRGA